MVINTAGIESALNFFAKEILIC